MSAEELEQGARQCLDPALFALIRDAAGEGTSARRNEAAFREWWIVPRLLRDVSTIDRSTGLLGKRVDAPFGVAPLPQLGRVHDGAEAAVAAAAARRGVVYCAPTNASVAMEDLAVPGGHGWFQLYPHSDDAITLDLARRAGDGGYEALVITVDRPVAGAKTSERFKSTRPEDYPNLAPYASSEVVRSRHHPGFSWGELEHLQASCSLPIVLKGILSADDARLAVEQGCAAIWVSNHGGRQLDQAVCALDVVEEIVQVVAGRAQVYLDGGVRRGVDVFIALALGADAVFLGRPVAYALATGGRSGVQQLLDALTAELEGAMALAGTAQLREIERSAVRR